MQPGESSSEDETAAASDENGVLIDSGGDTGDDDDELSDRPASSTTAEPPPAKRSRNPSAPGLHQWKWEVKDLAPGRELPGSRSTCVKPRNLDHCRFDVQYFLEMIGEDNIRLITDQSNLIRVREGSRPPSVAPITERDIRQWLGILMYMSVVQMPTKRLYWSTEVRSELVPSAMSRTRFTEISSCIQLVDSSLQHPSCDRLYRVRQFLGNLSTHFADLARIEEVWYVPYQYRYAVSITGYNTGYKFNL